MNKLLIQCRLYRKLIHQRFGLKGVGVLSIPIEILGDFDVCYLSYDQQGNVHRGFATLRDAIKHRGALGLTVLY